MQKDDLRKLFLDLFGVDITSTNFRKFDFEKKFEKKVLKLKGKEVFNLLDKVIEIISSEDLNRYKNLRYDLKRYRRVHVNGSYVIIFYDDETNKVFFVDYDHHDKVYKK